MRYMLVDIAVRLKAVARGSWAYEGHFDWRRGQEVPWRRVTLLGAGRRFYCVCWRYRQHLVKISISFCRIGGKLLLVGSIGVFMLDLAGVCGRDSRNSKIGGT